MSIPSVGSPDFFIDPQAVPGPSIYKLAKPLKTTKGIPIQHNKLYVIEMVIDSPTRRQLVLRPVDSLISNEKAMRSIWLDKHVGVVFYKTATSDSHYLLELHEERSKLTYNRNDLQVIAHYRGEHGGIFYSLGTSGQGMCAEGLPDKAYKQLYKDSPLAYGSIHDVFTKGLAVREGEKKEFSIPRPTDGKPSSAPPSPDLKPAQGPSRPSTPPSVSRSSSPSPTPPDSPQSLKKDKDKDKDKGKDKCLVM